MFTLRAGDSYQMNSLAKELEKINVKVDFFTSKNQDLKEYDLIHVFNILRVHSCLKQCKYFHKKNSTIILTPIYWDLLEYLSNYSPERIKYWLNEEKKRQEILNLIDYLAPNAEGEYLIMKNNFNFSLPHTCIYNGVEKDFLFKNNFSEKKYILVVGRIHPRKNQLNMIRAVKGLALPVLIIGKVNDKNYFRRCKKESKGENITFIEEMPRLELKKYYKKCRVHMMVSWYDTPGLVNLEAALAGANLLITNRGTTKDYFKDLVYYSSPLAINDIRKKLKIAYNEQNNNLQKYVFENFNWEKIAIKLKNLYKNLI
ncbi:MAG: glycosyltransferase family 4 protein [Bacillota bacterium]